MPAWIHGRAEHILAKNPGMPKSMAFALATQQSHAKGKTPKGYGTTAGKVVAKAKYDQPKSEYTGTANPQNLKTPKLSDKPTTKWTGSRLVKKSSIPWNFPIMAGLGAGAGAMGATLYLVGKGGRKRMSEEIRDPRLYSNLRGMATFEPKEERIKAHRNLKKGSGTMLSAMKIGLTREKKAAFQSQAQRRKFYAMEARGQISPSVVKEWESSTPKNKKLPERVKSASLLKTALLATTPIELGKVTKENVDREILRFGMIAELDAVSFYEQMAAKATDEKIKETLLDIAKEEKTHVGELQALLIELDEQYAQELEQGAQEVKQAVAGGKSQAADKDPEDFPPRQIQMGLEVEKEHTSDPAVAKRIAADHLTEFPDYYDRLKVMEEEAKKTLEKKSYAVSEYSGPLSYGPFQQESYIPPFRSPQLKTAGPPSQKKKTAAWGKGHTLAALTGGGFAGGLLLRHALREKEKKERRKKG